MIAIIILHVVFGMSLSQDTPSCNCKNDFGMAFCYNVRACPEFVTIARVECAIKEIIVKPNTSLDQVLIHGQCTNISAYKRFCMQAIKEIKMQATSESFLCAGSSILFISSTLKLRCDWRSEITLPRELILPTGGYIFRFLFNRFYFLN